MFGITTPPSRPNANRNTQNPHEEIRGSSHSGGYDAGGAERMKMEYLKKEKARRERERAQLEYESKKREYDGLVSSEERFKSEQRRLQAELERYEHDARAAEGESGRSAEEVARHKKEADDLAVKIQKLEADLVSYKNQHQRFMQEVRFLEQKDKTAQANTSKREAYVAGIKSKIEISKRNQEHYHKDIERISEELAKLKKLL